MVDDSELPLSVFENIVNSKHRISEKPKNKKVYTTHQKQPTSYIKRNHEGEESHDALDYRLPGSYGTGKRR